MSNTLQETYARFEDRFRGSRDEIRKRLRVYEPLLALARAGRDGPTAVDYGCGRGEWLEVLQQAGWNGHGVDTNVAMLAIASKHGARVERADALAHLGRSQSASVDLVSAFHLVEHLPIETLLAFIREAFRVLRPDGVLLLETPNPENLLVGTCNFYLDPTHQRPLPPMLLNFLVEDGGSGVARIVRLNGETLTGQPGGPAAAALRPMFTTAFDYAVIGSRSSDPAFVEALDRFVDAASQPGPVDLARIDAIDAASRLERDDVAAAIAATHVALGRQGEHLQVTTDRLTREIAAAHDALGAQGHHLQATTDRITQEVAGAHVALAEQGRHLQAATDRITQEVAGAHVALAEQGRHLQATTDRITQAVAGAHAALAEQGNHLQVTTDRTTHDIAAAHVALAQQGRHLQAETDRMGLALERIEAEMTEKLAREATERTRDLAQVLAVIEARLAPIDQLPTIGKDLEQVRGHLQQVVDRVGARERELEAQVRSAHAALQDQARQLAEAQRREASLNEYVAALLASRSWRITRPLRALTDLRAGHGRSAAKAEPQADVARIAPTRKRRSFDPQRFLMIDADPGAVAAWEALLTETRSREQAHASVD